MNKIFFNSKSNLKQEFRHIKHLTISWCKFFLRSVTASPLLDNLQIKPSSCYYSLLSCFIRLIFFNFIQLKS